MARVKRLTGPGLAADVIRGVVCATMRQMARRRMARHGLEVGFQLDRQWHVLRGELERSKRPALVSLTRVLADTGTPYAIIGGIALQVHQEEPRTTLEIDLAVRSSDSIPRAELRGAGFTPTGRFNHSEHWLGPEGTPVQFTNDPALAGAIERADEVELEDVRLRVIGRVDLLHEKLRAAADPAGRRSKRLQDLADAQALLEGTPALRTELTAMERATLGSLPLPAASRARPRQNTSRRTRGGGWRYLRTALAATFFTHTVLALGLLGSYPVEASKPRSPDQAVSRICEQRFQMLKEDTPIQIAVCTNRDQPEVVDGSVERAVIVVHGASRNATGYYMALTDAVTTSGRRDVLVVAPQFLTDEDVADLDPKPDVITWGSSNWNHGDRSESPTPAGRISSFEVLDKLVEDIGGSGKYPKLGEIVVAGHSAGGQVVQRYAAGTRIEQSPTIQSRDVQVRYVVANPSSYLYLFPLERDWSQRDCRGINEYKYGLNDLNSYMRAVGPDAIRASYPSKDIVVLLGRLDHKLIEPSKDDSCEAWAQGSHRLNRGVRFVGHLEQHYGAGNHKTRLTMVPGAGHSAWAMFNSPEGRRALLGT